MRATRMGSAPPNVELSGSARTQCRMREMLFTGVDHSESCGDIGVHAEARIRRRAESSEVEESEAARPAERVFPKGDITMGAYENRNKSQDSMLEARHCCG